MVTNNDIRRYLGIPESIKDISIRQVDALGPNKNTLMFSNRVITDLGSLDTSLDCVFLLDDRCPEYESPYNDYIRVQNPKYVFCRIVDWFNLKSRFQLEEIPKLNYNDIVIGPNCIIEDGVILGGTDFSPVMGPNRGVLVQFPQMGGVKIGENVVIKYNTMVGKGTFGFTTIGDYCQIDYNCQIGHNCQIGSACIIAAGSIIGGSTIIGENTTIGMGCMIRNGLHIGSNVSIGMGSVVIEDIPDNSVVVGHPAKVIKHNQIFDERGLV